MYAGAAKNQWQSEVWKRDQLLTPLFILSLENSGIFLFKSGTFFFQQNDKSTF